jgi:hypothetical protein
VALAGLAAGLISVGAPAGPSSADPLGPARANASALSRLVLQEAQLVHERTVQYQAEASHAGLLREELSGSEATAQALRLRAAQTGSLVRQEALLSYADAVPVVGAGGQSSADLVEVTDQTTYLALTVGDLAGTLKLLETERSQLAGTVAKSRRQLESALEAEGSAAAARQAALREAGSLQVLLSRAQSQVAALTAAERPRTGPPVGDGIVKAVSQELGAAPGSALAGGAKPARAAIAVKEPKAGPARTAVALSTLVTTTLQIPTTTVQRTTTTGRPTTTTGEHSTTTTRASSTTSTTPAGTVGPTTSTSSPSSTPSSAAPTSSTTSSTSTPATPSKPPTPSTPASSTTTSTVPPPPTTTTPPTTAPPTTPAPTSAATTTEVHPPPAGGLWLELRECESGNNYQADTGNGYYGAYQFSGPTWVDLGYPGRPDEEPYWMQDEAAQRLEAMDGWSQWPSCSTALGV